MPVHHESGSTRVTCPSVASATVAGSKAGLPEHAARARTANAMMIFFILFHCDFVCPRSLELSLYGHLVVRKGAGEYEGAVIGRKNLEHTALVARCQSSIVMASRDELFVEVRIFIILPRRDRILFKECKSVVPAHFLTGVDHRVSPRKRKYEHCHKLSGISHSSEFGSGP